MIYKYAKIQFLSFMLTNSCISNMYYGSNPNRVGTDENYDLKSKKLHSLQ